VNQFDILENSLFSFYAPYFIVIDGVLCIKSLGIIVDFSLLGLKDSLEMKVTKEKVRILLLIITVPLGYIGIDNFGLALIFFQNMASKSIDDVPEVFALFLRKHDPIFHSGQNVNVLPQFLIVNDSFVPSIVNIIGKVDYLRLLRYFVVEKWLFLYTIQPVEISE